MFQLDTHMTQEDGFDRLYRWYVGDDAAEALHYEIENVKSQLAEVAYNLRTQHGLSLQELAEITAIDPHEIDDLEEGDYPGMPKHELIRKIETILEGRFGSRRGNSI